MCPKCGGNLVLNREFQLVCEKCGNIVSLAFSLKRRWKNNENNFKYHYIRRPIKKLYFRNPYPSTHYRIIQTLQKICSRLGINKNVRERTINIYFKAIKNFKNPRPNYYRLIAASLAVALRESNMLIPPNEIWKAFLEDGHRFSKTDFYKAFYTIRKYSSKKIGLEEKIIKYITYILKKIFENNVFIEKTQKKLSTAKKRVSLREYRFLLLKKAVQLTRNIDWKSFQSRSPIASALSILYIADYILCKKLDIEHQILTQRFLSNISGVALSTIVIRLRMIREQLTGNLSE